MYLANRKINYLLQLFENDLNQHGYEQIIKHYLTKFSYKFPKKKLNLIADNDPKHSSAICKALIDKNKINWVHNNYFYKH